jgi:hypothetical protein
LLRNWGDSKGDFGGLGGPGAYSWAERRLNVASTTLDVTLLPLPLPNPLPSLVLESLDSSQLISAKPWTIRNAESYSESSSSSSSSSFTGALGGVRRSCRTALTSVEDLNTLNKQTLILSKMFEKSNGVEKYCTQGEIRTFEI